jgi:predicted phage terminase large subunit-like protein
MERTDPKGYRELIDIIDQIDRAEGVSKARSNFMDFVLQMWPAFIHGKHHKRMANLFDQVLDGKKNRVIINMGPRHTKSEFASWLLPAYFLGKYPGKKIIQCSNTAELAVGFGRKVRNLVATEEYQRVFPGTELTADSKAAGRWATKQGGEYFAIGVGGTVSGKGADLLIIDDPHSEQEALSAQGDPGIFNKVYEWYTSGPRQRLQPGAKIILVQTRWATNDLTGRLIRAQAEAHDEKRVDNWEVIELPAILPSGEPLWPEFWKKEELERTKNGMPIAKWSAQYMQQPTSEEGALIKREWWRMWEFPNPPQCSLTMVSGDLAFTASDRANYSAFTRWGVFEAPNSLGKTVPQLILLDAWRVRMEFPDLKKAVYDYYMKTRPDMFLLENKAAGIPLIQELRATGIAVTGVDQSRGTMGMKNDKIARVNAVSDIFASGMVWASNHPWATEVIEECASFPNGEYDDWVDTVTQALQRFRQGGFIRLASDEQEEEFVQRRVAAYY